MARPAILLVFAALALLPGVIGAQTPEPEAPTPGPNEVVYTGVVPAPAGTEVTAQFVIPPSWDFVVCATMTTTAIEGEDSGRSAFALVVDAECVLGSPVEPKFCWGDDHCYLPLRLRPVGWPLREDELVRQVSLGVIPSWPGGPNDVVYLGEVPAPPGTEVAAHFLHSSTARDVVCGTATTTAVPDGDPDRSEFILLLDYDCMYATSFGPGICWGPWGEGPCYPYMMPGNAPGPGPGEMADSGLLPLPERNEDTGPPPLPHGDRGPDIEPPPTGTGLLHAGSGPDVLLPDTGSRRSPDHGHWAIWLAWATAGLLGAGFAFAALGVVVRRRP